MVCVSASVNLPLHHKVQKFSSGSGSPGCSGKRAIKWLWWWCYHKLLTEVQLLMAGTIEYRVTTNTEDC